MKKLLALGFAVLLFAACQQEQRYTQQSPEIDTVKKLIKNYNDKTYDASIYADTSKTNYNTKGKGMSPSETIEYHKANDAMYSSRGFLDKDQEYEMVKTDDGNTWVNCWLDWKGTLAANGKEFLIPIHLTYQFVDGKIVREVGMWDPSAIVLELQAINNMSADEKLIATNVINLAKAWIQNDMDSFNSLTVENLGRSVNGLQMVKSQKEYRDLIASNHAMLSDINIVTSDLMINGNKAYFKWTFSGKNTKDIEGMKATNKPVSINGFAIWSFNNEGKATYEEVYFDQNDINIQLGYTLTPPN